MSRRFRPFTYANVVATLALFVALGGTSYAALTISGKNVKNGSLSGADVKNSSLTGSDVKNNSLSGADVQKIKSADISDGALLAKDFKSGQLPSGARGPQGAAGATNVVIRTATTAIPANATGSTQATATCDAGERAVGGGGELSAAGGDDALVKSAPGPVREDGATATTWTVVHHLVALPMDRTQNAYVLCARP